MSRAAMLAALLCACTSGTMAPDASLITADAELPLCSAGQWSCDGATRFRCGGDGRSRSDVEVCESACDRTRGCVTCVPGARRCDGAVSMVCEESGSAWRAARDCAEWRSSCGSDGYCDDACAVPERLASFEGCEYWAATLPNEVFSELFEFRVLVGNPGDEPAHVVFEQAGRTLLEDTVLPAETRSFALPWIASVREGLAVENRSFVAERGAYRLRSDRPVTASQFAPFELAIGGDYVATSDASLLLPSHSLGREHVVATYVPVSAGQTADSISGRFHSQIYAPPYVAVIGVDPTPTRVVVRSPVPLRTDTAARITSYEGGRRYEVTVREHEVVVLVPATPPLCGVGRPGHQIDTECWHSEEFDREFCATLESCRESGADPTGARVSSERPVVVFAGHECAFVPYGRHACDQLEEQVLSVSRLGREYVGAPMGPGTTNLLRVVAPNDSTEVSIERSEGTSSQTLASGEHIELEIDGPYHVVASGPVLVAQFMVGQGTPASDLTRGDPSMVNVVPVAQFRQRYDVALPESYNHGENGQSYLLLVRRAGDAVRVDGELVDVPAQRIGGFETLTVPVSGGPHRIEGDREIGAIMFGVGTYTSYATAAGIGLALLE